nr:MAG TPA: hypothetical protein [Caudoviricetes sp.]
MNKLIRASIKLVGALFIQKLCQSNDISQLWVK